MPIENEVKMLLLESPLVEEIIAAEAERTIQIDQKYFSSADKGLSVRVRRVVEKGIHSYYMTVKKDIDRQQVVEIETPIIEYDFKKLWPLGENKVLKTRYLYCGWEIDFFKNKGENYLAIAEFEMPEGQKKPDKIPNLINDYIIFAVPLGDKRFSNKKLGDIKYASSLLSEVKKSSNVRIVEPIKESKKFKYKG